MLYFKIFYLATCSTFVIKANKYTHLTDGGICLFAVQFSQSGSEQYKILYKKTNENKRI